MGTGAFARRPITAGAAVGRLGGVVVTTAELQARLAAREADPGLPFVDTVTVGDDAHLVLPAGTVLHHVNHACDPTLELVGRTLVARRDVAAGEELTTDYETFSGAPGFSMACRCGGPRCRGRLGG
ncbi:MAG TPA: SET domain-containing protein-lysine N-methyltransferase [Iamia sp.]